MDHDLSPKIEYFSRKRLMQTKEKYAEYDILLKCDETWSKPDLLNCGLDLHYEAEQEGVHFFFGRIEAMYLEAICDLDFVEKIEISKFLYLE